MTGWDTVRNAVLLVCVPSGCAVPAVRLRAAAPAKPPRKRVVTNLLCGVFATDLDRSICVFQ